MVTFISRKNPKFHNARWGEKGGQGHIITFLQICLSRNSFHSNFFYHTSQNHSQKISRSSESGKKDRISVQSVGEYFDSN